MRVALKILVVAWIWLVFAGALIAIAGRDESAAPEAPEPVAVAMARVDATAPVILPATPTRPTAVEIQPPAPRAVGEAGLFGAGGPTAPTPAPTTDAAPPTADRPRFVSGIAPPPTTPAPTEAVATPVPPAPVQPAPVQAAPAPPVQVQPAPAQAAPVAPLPTREPTPQVALVPAPARAAPPTPPPAPPVARQVAVPPRPPAVVRAGGAWQQYRRPFNLADPRPRVAVVIGELGVGAAATETAMGQLPGGVTLLFNSATPLPVLQDLVVRARATGHEVLITLPLNPEAVPVASLSEAQDVAGYAGGLLDRLGGAAGIVPSQVVGLTGAAALRATLGHAQRRGMMVVGRSGGPVLDTARQLQLPRLVFDATLDDQVGRVTIDARLAALEQRARETGIAIAYGRPYAVTIQRVNAWIQGLEARGIALAPTTALVPRYRDR